MRVFPIFSLMMPVSLIQYRGRVDRMFNNKVEYLQNELKFLIEANKEKYYSRISKRIINPLTSTKTYW